MKRTHFIIGSGPLRAWEEKHPDAKWIVFSGNIPYEIFEQLCLDFDYNRYHRISFEEIIIGNKMYENEYQMTIAEYGHVAVYHYSAKLPVLDKMLLGKDCDFIVSDGGVYSLGGDTLYHMKEEKEIFIPNNVRHIADYAFDNYENLHHVHLNDGLKSIGKWSFCGSGIEGAELPDSLTTLGEGAFYMSDLERVKLSESLNCIPDECFSLCSLDSLNIPKSVKTIGNSAFRSAWPSHIDIPEGVEVIGYDAFEALDSISLPSTLLEIAPDFYYEDCIDSPDYPPYISVHPDNPVFYAKEGTLFFKKNGQVAIAHSYNGKNPSSRY